MGKYEKLKELASEEFRRLTGVQQDTFKKMVDVLSEAQHKRYRKAGRKGKTRPPKPSSCRQENQENYLHCLQQW